MMLSTQGYQMMCGGAASPVSETVARVMQMCALCPNDAADYLVNLLPEELAVVAKDSQGSRYLQRSLSEKKQLRNNVLHLLIDKGMLVPMATDCFANFVVQKMLSEPDVAPHVANALLQNALQLSCNHYACRVIQKMALKLPVDRVHKLFNAYSGSEGDIVKNQHANHILQRIMEVHPVEVYSSFIEAIAKSPGITHLMLDKYGCRVVQMCLEKTVVHCFNPNVPKATKRVAFEVLHLLMTPILEHARALSENDYANYIVQYVLRSEFLNLQRQFIIHNAILHNILWLSQGKFSSHVVEQALCCASTPLLRAMFNEVLVGYERDGRGRDALDIMLFDQYGNYVVQCLFKIAIKVCRGEREGDKEWFAALAYRVKQSESNLRRYSSGKKLLQMLADIMRGALPVPPPPQLCFPPTSVPSFVQPAPMSYPLPFFQQAPPQLFHSQPHHTMLSPLPPMMHRSGPVTVPPPLLLPPLESWPAFPG